MKNLIITTLFILICFSIYSQNKTYEVYRCSYISTRSYNGYSWSAWNEENENLLIRNNLKDNVLEIENQGETKLYMIDIFDRKTGIDEDNDRYSKYTWNCFDHNGRRCHLVVIDYPDLPNRNYWLQYQDAEAFYSCVLIVKADL